MNSCNPPVFVFDDLLYISDEDVIAVLREVDNVTLLVACQGVEVTLIWRIASVFSKTARGYFFDDINQFYDSSAEQIEEARAKIQGVMDDLYYNGVIHSNHFKASA